MCGMTIGNAFLRLDNDKVVGSVLDECPLSLIPRTRVVITSTRIAAAAVTILIPDSS